MCRSYRFLIIAGILFLVCVRATRAQPAPALPRSVDVEGRSMHVWTAGVDERKDGQPVVVLEAGGGDGLDTWKPVFAGIASVAPVLAYDRRGIGQSAPDSAKLTLRRVAQSLHALLQRLNIPPPYVLVGHSWGGLLARAYIDQYAGEVTGLVLVEALHPGRTRIEEAKKVAPEKRAAILAPPELPPIPSDTPPGLRAEYELIGSEMVNDYPEARSLREPSGIPIVVVSALPPGRLKSKAEEGLGLGPQDQAGLALRSPKGMFVAASHVRHMVHRDDPELVLQLIRHVLKHAAPAASAR